MDIPATAELLDQRDQVQAASVKAATMLEIDRQGLTDLGASEPELANDATDQDRTEWHHRRSLRGQLPETIRKGERRLVFLDDRLSFIAHRLEVAAERDQLQTERPEGCWCFGKGGREPRSLPPVGDDMEPRIVLHEYCTCPEATERKTADDHARQRFDGHYRRARVSRFFGDADLPIHFQSFTFASYPVSDPTQPVLDYLQRYARMASGDHGPSVMLTGEVGRGKTGLAVATFKAIHAYHGTPGLYIVTRKFLERIKASFDGDEKTVDIMRAVQEVPLLLMDDLGAELDSDWAQHTLLGLIDARHGQELRTIFTSNLTPKQMVQELGDRLQARVSEMCSYGEGVIDLIGPNLRDPEERPEL